MTEPRCKVCQHTDREQIETLLLAGVPKLSISRKFGVSRDSLKNHEKKHIPAQLLRAARIREYAAADSLLDKIGYLEQRALAFLDIAESRRSPVGAAALLRELRELAELTASVTGEVERIRIQADLTAHPVWLRIQATVLRAARRDPALLSELRREFSAITAAAGRTAAVGEPAARSRSCGVRQEEAGV